MSINPFILSEKYTPQHFCDRVKETEKIVSAMKNGRNLTLFSNRRLGKTALLHHVLYRLQKKENMQVFYIDILGTNNLGDFVTELGKAIIGKLDAKPAQILKKTAQLFSYLRPKLVLDQLSGEPGIEIDVEPGNVQYSLDELFNYLSKKGKTQKIVIAIDEFQQIGNYPENNTERLLRSKIQLLNNVGFIFSGSQKHLLVNMFTNSKHAFYRSTELLELNKIEHEAYKKFIMSRFSSGKKNISSEDTDWLLNLVRRHTFYVQYLCNNLYSSKEKKINREQIAQLLLNTLTENEAVYVGYRHLVTQPQWMLLLAIAREDGAENIYRQEFIAKHKLNAVSTIKRSIQALIDKELILQDDTGKYYVQDVFLAHWLKRL